MVTLKNPKQVREENVPLSTLKSLQSASFLGQLPKHATRDVKPEHVANLCNAIALTTDNVVTPFIPLDVVSTNEGFFIVDGNHRREAIERYLRMVVLQLANNETLSAMAMGRSLKQELDETLQKQLDTLRSTVRVPVKVGVYTDLNEVAKFALTANIQEGLHLQPDNKSRSIMAAEYYNLLVTMGEKPVQAQVARLFSIGRSSLNEYLNEKGLRADKPETVASGSEEGSGPEEKAEKTEEEKFSAKLVTALKLLESVEDLTPYIKQLRTDLTTRQLSLLDSLANASPKQQHVAPKGAAKPTTKPSKKGDITLDSKDSQVPVQEEATA